MLEKLKNSIAELIALYEAEKAEKESLRSSLAEREAEADALRKRITELEDKMESLRLSAAFNPSGGSNASAKEKIDRMIREIDKCISALEG